MAEMKALLSFMDAEDRLKVMRRYERRFDAAGREGEDALIRELGSPVRQILMIEKEYREREEAGLPGIDDEAYAEEAAVSETESLAAEAAVVMEKLLAEEAQEEFVPLEEPIDEEAAVEFDSEEAEEEQPEAEQDEEAEEAPGAGRVLGAVALTPVMIAVALISVAMTAALTALGILPGLGLGAAAVYLALYAFNSMNFLPDILLVSGMAVVAVALCIFFLWLGIWLLVEGISLTIRLISRVYGKVLRKGGAEDE